MGEGGLPEETWKGRGDNSSIVEKQSTKCVVLLPFRGEMLLNNRHFGMKCLGVVSCKSTPFLLISVRAWG